MPQIFWLLLGPVLLASAALGSPLPSPGDSWPEAEARLGAPVGRLERGGISVYVYEHCRIHVRAGRIEAVSPRLEERNIVRFYPGSVRTHRPVLRPSSPEELPAPPRSPSVVPDVAPAAPVSGMVGLFPFQAAPALALPADSYCEPQVIIVPRHHRFSRGIKPVQPGKAVETLRRRVARGNLQPEVRKHWHHSSRFGPEHRLRH